MNQNQSGDGSMIEPLIPWNAQGTVPCAIEWAKETEKQINEMM